jgi:hypothetical protein
MSIVCAGYGAVSPPVSPSNCSSAAWAFGINALARLIDIASKLGRHNLYLIVVTWSKSKGGLIKKRIREGTLLKVGLTIVHKVIDPDWKRKSHFSGSRYPDRPASRFCRYIAVIIGW